MIAAVLDIAENRTKRVFVSATGTTSRIRRGGAGCKSAGAGPGQRTGGVERSPVSDRERDSRRYRQVDSRPGRRVRHRRRLCRIRRAVAPMVEWRGIRGLVGINMTGDAVADGVRPVRGVRPDRVIMGAIPGMIPAIEWDGARLLHGENVASDAVGIESASRQNGGRLPTGCNRSSGTRRSP